MNTEKTRQLRETIKLYEEKRQEALYQQPYDNAISILKQEINGEFNQ